MAAGVVSSLVRRWRERFDARAQQISHIKARMQAATSYQVRARKPARPAPEAPPAADEARLARAAAEAAAATDRARTARSLLVRARRRPPCPRLPAPQEWRELAEQLDNLDANRLGGRCGIDEARLYDKKLLQQKLAHLQQVREGGNIREVMFNLRSDLIRNVANIAKRCGAALRGRAGGGGLPGALTWRSAAVRPPAVALACDQCATRARYRRSLAARKSACVASSGTDAFTGLARSGPSQLPASPRSQHRAPSLAPPAALLSPFAASCTSTLTRCRPPSAAISQRSRRR